MTLFSQLNLEGESPQQDIKKLLDKQKNGFEIEQLVSIHQLSYLEATSRWMEENSIPEGNHARFIPVLIIDKIKDEAINEHMLRPSMAKTEKTNSLDFLL